MVFRVVFLQVLFLSFLSINVGFGQEKYVPDQLIIQMKNSKLEIEKVLDEFKNQQLKPLRCLSERLGIWLVEYKAGKESDRIVLETVSHSPHIANAQFNHYISLRDTEPNDTRFDEQWNFKNTGQSGGVVDADIDATEAWDITTGGFSADGDTIVIAIVDDGFFLNHQDLKFWINHNEIPANGIDDDLNGYKDDYYGWNSYSHTGNITSADHGTHVSGIAGARSNNNIGVAGVNWNAPILAAQGSSTVEAPVVEAYGYIYEVRSKYDETGGQQGAFVVATNASFGVNNGQPEDFPVWGAMYDSLGQLGILSCGATANANWNIDDVGDVPTAFPTPYMLSVTNTTKNDTKNMGAAYGLTTIDIGAPGTTVLSTRQNNTYGMKTGTSMASPHAAGAVALIFSGGDENFMDAYWAKPADVILLIKDYIIAGVDILPDLEGKTVSGGRLNVYNALNYLITPAFSITPNSLNVTLEENKTGSYKIGMENTGPVDLWYYTDTGTTPSWLSIVSGDTLHTQQTDSVEVHIGASGLSLGNHEGAFEIINLKGDHYSVDINLDVVPSSGISSPKMISGSSVYPNPFSSDVHIDLYLSKETVLNIEVCNILGERITTLAHNLKVKEGLNQFSWDGRNDNSVISGEGIYFIRISSEGFMKVLKLIKHH